MSLRPGVFAVFILSALAAEGNDKESDSLRLQKEFFVVYGFYLTYPDSALQIAQRNLDFCLANDHKFLEGSYYYLVSKANWAKGNLKLASEYGFKALRTVKDSKYIVPWGHALLGLGRTFSDLQDYVQANNFINNAIYLALKHDLKMLLADAYREKSIVLLEEKQYRSAHEYADKGIAIYQQFKDTLSLSILYGRKARIYFSEGNYDQSIKFTRLSIRFDSLAGNRRALGTSYLQAAQNAYALKKADSAIYFLNKAIPINTDFRNLGPLIRSYTLLSDIYLFQKQPLLAVQQLKIVNALKDSLYNLQKTGQVQGMRALYDLEAKENTIKLLEQENALKAQDVKTQHLIELFLGVVIVLLILLSFFFLRWRTVQTRANTALEQQNAAIEAQKIKIEAQAASLQELNMLKTKLFSVIGHDLRGPLANLHALLELLTENQVSADEFVELSGKLKAHLGVTQRTLENLLNWSLSQMDGIKTQQKKIDIAAFVEDSKRLMLEVAQQKKVSINTADVNAVTVVADPNQLHLVLRNIIHNAIKFSHENSEVSIGSRSDRDCCIISVRDRGIGMNVSEVTAINSASQHFTKAGTHLEQGTGLGLLLCKEFILKMGGSIRIESEEGKGTTVSITLPC